MQSGHFSGYKLALPNFPSLFFFIVIGHGSSPHTGFHTGLDLVELRFFGGLRVEESSHAIP
jgi:hypothetical protein